MFKKELRYPKSKERENAKIPDKKSENNKVIINILLYNFLFTFLIHLTI
tara:strand:- start:4297 stop:4443 length:147 start_codon:yes stop_codon:yes gene_type:complete